MAGNIVEQVARFLAKVDTHNDNPAVCWEWHGADKGNGYGHTSRAPAHRRAYKLFVGDVPSGMDVCHHCDNRGCVNPSHLFVGTRRDNMQDALRKGRAARGCMLPDRRGELGSAAKLTWAQIRVIRASELPSKKLAAHFGVTNDNINRIRRNETWKEF